MKSTKCSTGCGSKSTMKVDTTREFTPDWSNDSEDIFTAAQVIDLLGRIESYRVAIARAEARLQRWLDHSREFAALWQKFIAAGGITADEFQQFLGGKPRHRPTRQNKHLRLITNRNQRAVRPMTHGNDAA
jgi:hypothetical protein